MLDDWHDRFPGCPPVAHRLREGFPDRWVRFHALPGSRRYAADEADYKTILSRYNAVLTLLAEPGSPVVLLTTRYTRTPKPPARPAARPWWSFCDDEGDGIMDPSHWHVYASPRPWHPGTFDPIFRRVADDVVRNVMVVAPDCRWLFHPYDGGMDAILDTSAARDALRATHPGWLSSRPDGL